jgi:F-box and leucine-rich repeat protein GRR1
MAMAQDRSRSRGRRFSSIHSNSTSASTSPERPADDDNESFTMQGNDSVSSLGLSEPEQVSDAQADEIKERGIVSPISRLPAEIMIAIFQKLPHSSDYLSCMLVSREWARNSVGLLWHRPQTGNWPAVHNVVQTVRSAHAFFDYDHLVKRLNLSTLGPQVSDGTLMAFAGCKRIERLTLTNCTKLSDLSVHKVVQSNRALMALDVTGMENITDTTMHTVARYCYRLQGLNITNCRKITDESLEDVAQNCRHIKRVSHKFHLPSQPLTFCSSSSTAAISSQTDPSLPLPKTAATFLKLTLRIAGVWKTMLLLP